MARKSRAQPSEEVLVELLIRVEGSSELNRITTFSMPLTGRVEGDDETPGKVEFESLVLIRRIKQAVQRLV